MVLYVLQLFAVFVVRGRPYSGENVASVLINAKSCLSKSIVSTLAFSWNIVSSGKKDPVVGNSFLHFRLLDFAHRTHHFGHRFLFFRKIRRNVRLDYSFWLLILTVVGQGNRSHDAAVAHSFGSICGRHTELQILYEQHDRRKASRGMFIEQQRGSSDQFCISASQQLVPAQL